MIGVPTLETLREAAARIAPMARRTPVLSSRAINELAGAEIHFKCENFQRVGAFKFRGACNTVFSLSDDEAANGVATHSSGNHGQALALAARMRGVPAYVVVPENAAAVKKAALGDYGAELTFCAPSMAAREEAVAKVVDATGATLIHPYNDYSIIAGQGTAALELMEETPDLDAVIVPVGGGGLLSGTAIAVKGLSRDTQVIGAEPSGADDAYESFQSGHLVPLENPDTIADGLVASLGDKTFPIIRDLADNIVTVDDEAIIRAMRLTWERMKIVIEPSAAVPLAAVISGALDVRAKRAGIILSGGNVDLDKLPWGGEGGP